MTNYFGGFSGRDPCLLTFTAWLCRPEVNSFKLLCQTSLRVKDQRGAWSNFDISLNFDPGLCPASVTDMNLTSVMFSLPFAPPLNIFIILRESLWSILHQFWAEKQAKGKQRLFYAQLNDNVNVPIQGSAAYHTPGVPHYLSKKVPPKLTIIAEIARHFLDFSSILGKMQFCRGFDLEKQLQLIAAPESHLSFIFGFTQHRNQKLAEEKTG